VIEREVLFARAAHKKRYRIFIQKQTLEYLNPAFMAFKTTEGPQFSLLEVRRLPVCLLRIVNTIATAVSSTRHWHFWILIGL